MLRELIDRLATIDQTWSGPHGLGPGATLTLRRAWPAGPDHLLLEYLDNHGNVVGGQWSRVPRQLDRAAKRLPPSSPGVPDGLLCKASTHVLIQGRGIDRDLPALAGWASRPGATLISHRPTRRAVVRLDGAEVSYAKLLTASRFTAAHNAAVAAASLAAGRFATPAVLSVHAEDGCIVLGGLPGRSLHDLLTSSQATDVLFQVGRALRTLHDAPHVPGLATHSSADEAHVLERWLQRLAPFDQPLCARFQSVATTVFRALPADPLPPTPLHRDFHEKQVIVDGHAVGFLDMDTLASGEPALDVANFLAHLELRAIQSPLKPAPLAASLLAGYEPSARLLVRLPAYIDSARLRLAILYSFRPGSPTIAPALLSSVGAPPTQD